MGKEREKTPSTYKEIWDAFDAVREEYDTSYFGAKNATNAERAKRLKVSRLSELLSEAEMLVKLSETVMNENDRRIFKMAASVMIKRLKLTIAEELQREEAESDVGDFECDFTSSRPCPIAH